MFDTKITVMSLVNLPHVVTKNGKVTERWQCITYVASVLQEVFISLLDLIATEPNFELPLKLPVSKHPIAKLFVRQNCFCKDHLENIID